jgi:FKBP-type peptidyl-prolyl cis-trans isomerase SlpA
MSIAKNNDKVKVHYTGKLNTGEVFDTSEGKAPLEVTLGSGQVIPGFDKGIQGMNVGEERTISIPCAEAYGEVREELIQEVPKKQLPPEIQPEVGMRLVSRTREGQEIPLVVSKMTEDSIIVDANHPLAGKDLIFDVKLVEIS